MIIKGVRLHPFFDRNSPEIPFVIPLKFPSFPYAFYSISFTLSLSRGSIDADYQRQRTYGKH